MNNSQLIVLKKENIVANFVFCINRLMKIKDDKNLLYSNGNFITFQLYPRHFSQ